jgi:hypothetical protein
MCPIHADFKHFPAVRTEEFRFRRNDSSIMRAKVLSIMPANPWQVTSG